MSWHVLSRRVVSCPVMSRHVTSRRDMSCLSSVPTLCVTPIVRRRVLFVTACYPTPRHTSRMSVLLMENAGKIAIPGCCVTNTREDVAKQEEKASDSSVQCKICVSVSPMFCYIDSDLAIWTPDPRLVI